MTVVFPTVESKHAARRRASRGVRCALLAAVLATVLVGGVSCNKPPPAVAAEGPRDVVLKLRAARAAKDYAAFDRLILPGRATEVVNVLLAFDEFLAADAKLGEFLREYTNPEFAGAVSQSHLAAALDVFSRNVEVLDARVHGDTADVGFTVDGRLPPLRASMRLVDGSWRYDPGAGYSPQLPEAFSRMARGLRQMHEDLKTGRIPVDAIHNDIDRLIDEIRTRLTPGLRMLPPPPGE